MRTDRRVWLGTALPIASVVLTTALVLRGEAQENRGTKTEVCRHRDLDGRGAEHMDLAALDRRYRSVAADVGKSFRAFESKASLPEMKARAHRSGIPAARSADERRVTLAEPVPKEFRKLTLYFVTALPDGKRPSCLPKDLRDTAYEVFVLESDRLEDVGALARTLRRRVSLASGEFARALGVTARDAVVRFADDGKTAIVRQEGP